MLPESGGCDAVPERGVPERSGCIVLSGYNTSEARHAQCTSQRHRIIETEAYTYTAYLQYLQNLQYVEYLRYLQYLQYLECDG